MDDLDRFEPQLAGIWRENASYGDPAADSPLMADVRMVLETKSTPDDVAPAEALRRLLNEMTVEMRAQFGTFRNMRRAAETALTGDDEAAQKLARADVKAATDAMSLIVRTLEKVDSLQRQLARDRQHEAEQSAEEGDYEQSKARLLQLIEVKADEKARALFEAWKRDGDPADSAFGTNGSGPPKDTG